MKGLILYNKKITVLYLQDTQTTFENYIGIARSTDARSRATEETLDNVHWDRRNRLFVRIGLQTCVQSLATLSRPKPEIPATQNKAIKY